MKLSKKLIAAFLVFSMLFSLSAFAADTVTDAEPNKEYTLSKERLAKIYDPTNYEDENFVAGEVIVGLNTYVPNDVNYSELFPEIEISEVDRLPLDSVVTIKIVLPNETTESVIEAINLLKNNPIVEYAQPNYYGQSASYVFTDIDPYYYDGSQWNLDFIDAPEAWEMTAGITNRVSVGVIDSGIYEHEDFEDNIYYEHGYNFIQLFHQANDDNGHGTQVAGIIGAVGDNGMDIAGVCWNVDLCPYKVLAADGYGSNYDVAEAITIAGIFEIPILNISYQSEYDTPCMEYALQNYSGLAVVAAGNFNYNLDEEYYSTYPASYATETNNIIAVAGLSQYGIGMNSNYGVETVQICAPGDLIYSLDITQDGINTMCMGTSYAAPHVAGVAALVLLYHPTYTTAQLKKAIINSANTDFDCSLWCSSGGVVNAKNALEYMAFTVGDINNDGVIDSNDRDMIAEYVVGLRTFTDDEFYCADINGDGIISNADIILIISLFNV